MNNQENIERLYANLIVAKDLFEDSVDVLYNRLVQYYSVQNNEKDYFKYQTITNPDIDKSGIVWEVEDSYSHRSEGYARLPWEFVNMSQLEFDEWAEKLKTERKQKDENLKAKRTAASLKRKQTLYNKLKQQFEQ
jgi:hypothetical protein